MGKFFKLGLVEIGFLVIVIIAILGALSYLNVFTLPNFSSLSPASKPSAPSGKVPATPVGLACPVSFKYCRNAKQTTFGDQPAIIYTVDQNEQIFSMGKATSYSVLNVSTKIIKAKMILTSFIFNKKCYTATYIIPPTTELYKLSAPFAKQTPLGKFTGDLMTLNKQSFNLMVLLQGRGIDTKKPESQQCVHSDTNQTENGNYINHNPQDFD